MTQVHGYLPNIPLDHIPDANDPTTCIAATNLILDALESAGILST